MFELGESYIFHTSRYNKYANNLLLSQSLLQPDHSTSECRFRIPQYQHSYQTQFRIPTDHNSTSNSLQAQVNFDQIILLIDKDLLPTLRIKELQLSKDIPTTKQIIESITSIKAISMNKLITTTQVNTNNTTFEYFEAYSVNKNFPPDNHTRNSLNRFIPSNIRIFFCFRRKTIQAQSLKQ